jgi:hypothetical protein
MLYDPRGSCLLEVHTIKLDRQRRSSRVPTLDGSASFYDTGFSVADQEMSVQGNIGLVSQLLWENLCYLVETHQFISVSTRDGFYIAKPDKLTLDSNLYNFNLLLKEKLT